MEYMELARFIRFPVSRYARRGGNSLTILTRQYPLDKIALINIYHVNMRKFAQTKQTEFITRIWPKILFFSKNEEVFLESPRFSLPEFLMPEWISRATDPFQQSRRQYWMWPHCNSLKWKSVAVLSILHEYLYIIICASLLSCTLLCLRIFYGLLKYLKKSLIQ